MIYVYIKKGLKPTTAEIASALNLSVYQVRHYLQHLEAEQKIIRHYIRRGIPCRWLLYKATHSAR